MNERRDFLKKAAVVTAGAVVATVLPDRAKAVNCPAGLIYTSKEPGHWAGKAASHAPEVKRKGQRIIITTLHPMSAAHYIVRHTLVSADGEILGAKTFFPSDKKARSSFTVPPGKKPRYATSFCNKHDFWLTEIK